MSHEKAIKESTAKKYGVGGGGEEYFKGESGSGSY